MVMPVVLNLLLLRLGFFNFDLKIKNNGCLIKLCLLINLVIGKQWQMSHPTIEPFRLAHLFRRALEL